MKFLKRHKKSISASLIFLLLIIIFLSNTTLRVLFSNKVWGHRTNSIEKLENSDFDGVELDVVFYSEKNIFDVNHPPEKSNNINLERYLKSGKGNGITNYWIDFKNLSSDNKFKALNRLNAIINKHNINPQNIIIESTHPQWIKSFTENGYKTAYYLPQNLNTLNSIEISNMIIHIKEELDISNTTYISSSYNDYKIITQYFPDQKKIFWFNVYGSNNKIKVRFLLYQILMDNSVDVLLIP